MKQLGEIAKKWGYRIWTAIVAFGVVFGIWIGYQEIFDLPQITSQVIGESNVLDVHQPLANLQVLFQGNNIQQNNLNLKIYKVRLENTGGTDITQNDFDHGGNWGLRVDSGNIIEARLVDAGSDYLKNNLLLSATNTPEQNFLKFNKVLFDKGDFFTTELLILHDKNTLPELYRFGKISGIKEDLSEVTPLDNDESFITAFTKGVMYGGKLVSIFRFLVYFIISIALFMAIIFIIVKIEERKNRARQNPQPPQQPSK